MLNPEVEPGLFLSRYLLTEELIAEAALEKRAGGLAGTSNSGLLDALPQALDQCLYGESILPAEADTSAVETGISEHFQTALAAAIRRRLSGAAP